VGLKKVVVVAWGGVGGVGRSPAEALGGAGVLEAVMGEESEREKEREREGC